MNTYHFIGIGGIGMSALARILLQKGHAVHGSDLASSYVTEGLKKAGAKIVAGHAQENVTPPMTVIYGTDVRGDNPEFQAAQTKKLPILHRADLLAELLQDQKPLLVTGTHGKTTTSALLAHLLLHAGEDPSYAVGGVVLNMDSNGSHGKGEYFVAEADESDGSFLKYGGYGAIITNIENDHLNYWKTEEALIAGFAKFAATITDHLVWCADDAHLQHMNLPGTSYGFSEHADLKIETWRQEGWKLIFDLAYLGKNYRDITIPLIGKHNVANAAAVFGLGLLLGLEEKKIRNAFEVFQGVKRRMEKRGEKRAVQIFDDYGHHPTEIRVTLDAIKAAIGERRLVVAFQPHRYTRTRDCFHDFRTALKSADVLVMADIYPARETPIEGITGEALFCTLGHGHFVPRDQMADFLASVLRPHDVLVTMGAGDITQLASEVLAKEIPPYKLGVLDGGKSAEYEVSLSSAKVVSEAINPEYYAVKKLRISKEGVWMVEGKEKTLPEIVNELLECDLILPMMHGSFSEDGMLQGFFETLNIPYVGCDYRAGPIAMDKAWAKRIALTHGIAIADFVEFHIHEDSAAVLQKITTSLRFPLFVKPVHLGSTYGVKRVTNREELAAAIEEIAPLDYKFLAEEEVIGREIEFGLLGDTQVAVADPAEVMRGEEIYTYEGKYGSNPTPTKFKTSLPPEISAAGKKAAETIYRACGCSGLARIDFFLKPSGSWVFNEINPMPGCTPTSAFPKIWAAEGIPFTHVIDRIVIAALHRKRYQDRCLRPPL
jgi:UDP-N-acetylmuramate--alanine ligase